MSVIRTRTATHQPLVATMLVIFVTIPTMAGAVSNAPIDRTNAGWIGYGGPGGTRVYRNVTPPTTFDEKNRAWQTELPSWGHGSPIVASQRVYLTVEPVEGRRDFPALICLDAKTGKILWDRPLDHTAELPENTRDAGIAAWRRLHSDFGKCFELKRRYDGKELDDQGLAGQGYEYNKRWSSVVPKDKAAQQRDLAVARKAGFDVIGWRHDCAFSSIDAVGVAYATPVSDGNWVYVHTGWGGYFCFDLDGKLLWRRYLPTPPLGAWGDPDGCMHGRSPILWKAPDGRALMLSDIGNRVRALDAATGELKWSDDKIKSHTVVTPAVITVNGTDILFAAGCSAYELPSGKKLVIEGWSNEGMLTLVKNDEPDVIFFCGVSEHCGWAGKSMDWSDPSQPTSPAAVRFKRVGDALKAEVIWDGHAIVKVNERKSSSSVSCGIGILYDAGKFYHSSGAIFDAGSGKIIAGQITRDGQGSATPKTMHLMIRAGDHVFGLTAQGEMGVFTADGKRVSVTRLPTPPEATEPVSGTSYKKRFSYGCPFTFGSSAVYVRALRHVICFGNPSE